MRVYQGFLLFASALDPLLVHSCGMSTHLLVSKLALDFINNSSFLQVSLLSSILIKHNAHLQAGSFFPDWGYMCSNHDAAEDSHWPLFWNASVEYFSETYGSHPLATDTDLSRLPEKGQQLLAFLFGLYSHGVSDIVWHSLGFDQGFIEVH